MCLGLAAGEVSTDMFLALDGKISRLETATEDAMARMRIDLDRHAEELTRIEPLAATVKHDLAQAQLPAIRAPSATSRPRGTPLPSSAPC